MAEVTLELMYEVLKKLQEGQARIIETQADHSRRQLIQVRQDINNLRSDDLRRETMQAQMDMRLDRIENRLNLHDAE
jgi:hypothetical protein